MSKSPVFCFVSFSLFISLACLGIPRNGFGQEQSAVSLDAIPANAIIGMAWPKVTRLGPRAHKLAQEVYPGSGGLILSQARSFFREAGFDYNDPDFTKLIDRQKPGAIFAVEVGKHGATSMVNVIPAGDTKKVAAMYGIEHADLTSGNIVEVNPHRFVQYSGGFVYSALNNKALENADVTSNVRKLLTTEQQEQFTSSDAVLFFDDELGTGLFGDSVWTFADLAWLNIGGDDSTDEFTKLVSDSANEFSFGLAGIELDGGLGINFTGFFEDTAQDHIQKLIKTIRGGDGASNLDGLPNGDFVAAFAARGNGTQNVSAAKAFLQAIVRRISPGEEVLTAEDKPVFYNSFANVWAQLNGTRLGVYRIESDQEKGGVLSAIAVFDVADPNALLAQLPELVKFANESAERNTAKQDLLPIRFNYRRAVAKIGEHSADILEIDTDRLDAASRNRFRLLFGENARQITLVPVKDHVLMLIGSDTKLLTETIENLTNQSEGLSAHPAIVLANQRIDKNRKIEIHFSFRNLLNLYTFKDQPKPFEPSDEITSLAATVDPDRIGFDAWIPSKEIDAAIDWNILWY